MSVIVEAFTVLTLIKCAFFDIPPPFFRDQILVGARAKESKQKSQKSRQRHSPICKLIFQIII